MTEDNREYSMDEMELIERLEQFSTDDIPVRTVLKTDEKVIARVTDGIYRQPSSAFRELISNAYDADATLVRIQTDRPRFGRIVIDDNGSGMSPAAVAHMFHHIGGSAKRNLAGAGLGITHASDPKKSPGGRTLIGKIGIGLFSVAQLTQSFDLITKVRGDNYRTVAKVTLKRYSDDLPAIGESDGKYEAGKVLIWREPANDAESHGTTIVLDEIWPQTVQTLRSTAMWEMVESVNSDYAQNTQLRPPKYHIGTVSSENPDEYAHTAKEQLPWNPAVDPRDAFEILASQITNPQPSERTNPPLEKLLDYYLQMVWELSLWCPLPYADIHPFDLPINDDMQLYRTDNGRRVDTSGDPPLTIREALDLRLELDPLPFRVLVDDLELARPVRVRNFPHTASALQTPIIFAGSTREEFTGVDRELSGGALEFQAYLVWAPQIRPPDHQGFLVRVNNATGMLFDDNFMGFPAAEKTRLSQITCEIYISEGFDGALNIDRESFNFAHPHAVFLTRWLHRNLRRLITTQKRVASDALARNRATNADEAASKAEQLLIEVWKRESGGDGSTPPVVNFGDVASGDAVTDAVSIVYSRNAVLRDLKGKGAEERSASWASLLASIASILAAYGLLDNLEPAGQELLLKDIREQIEASGLVK